MTMEVKGKARIGQTHKLAKTVKSNSWDFGSLHFQNKLEIFLDAYISPGLAMRKILAWKNKYEGKYGLKWWYRP